MQVSRSPRFGGSRRIVAVLGGLALAITALVSGVGPSSASERGLDARPGDWSWVATWGAGVTGVPEREPDYPDGRVFHLDDQTLARTSNAASTWVIQSFFA